MQMLKFGMAYVKKFKLIILSTLFLSKIIVKVYLYFPFSFNNKALQLFVF